MLITNQKDVSFSKDQKIEVNKYALEWQWVTSLWQRIYRGTFITDSVTMLTSAYVKPIKVFTLTIGWQPYWHWHELLKRLSLPKHSDFVGHGDGSINENNKHVL